MSFGSQQEELEEQQPTLHNLTQGVPICQTLLVADTPWLRLRGLLYRPELAVSSGLLLLPSRSVHTFGMRHTIDVVFLDRTLQVLQVCPAVAPGQVRLGASGTQCVLELRRGEAARTGVAVGDRLQLQRGADAAPTAVPLNSYRPVIQRSGVWILLTLLVCAQLALLWSSRAASLQGRVDLRAYYAAGTAARLNGNATLYNNAAEQVAQQTLFHDGSPTLHFLYPPFAVLPYKALAALPYRSAFLAVSLASLLCLVASAWLLTRQHPEARLSPALLAMGGLCTLASVHALVQGQVSFVLLLLLTMFYCLERRGLHVLAGICLALCLVKVQIALPVAALYLLWRRYRVVAGFCAGAVLLIAISLSQCGMAGMYAYLARLHTMGTVTLLDGAAAHLQYGVHTATEPNLHGVTVLLLGSGMSSALLTALLSVLVLVWARRQPASIGTAVCVAVLLSYHLLLYDLLLLLLPLAIVTLPILHSGQHAALTGAARPRRDVWLLACSTLLLSSPVAACLMALHATPSLMLAAVTLLMASGNQRMHAAAPSGQLRRTVAMPTLSLAS